MNARMSFMLAPLLTLVLVGLGALWWYDTMEKQWNITYEQSDAASKNSMLGAQRLLERRKYPVQVEETLSSLLLKPAIPRGTMILAENDGLMTRLQANQILAWVARGNTLIMMPAWDVPSGRKRNPHEAPDGNDAQDNTDKDDIGAHFGVALQYIAQVKQICRDEDISEEKQKEKLPEGFTIIDCGANLTFPNGAYALHLGPSRTQLLAHDADRETQFSDDQGRAVRSYAHGKGQVIFVAYNYFDNISLASYDRGEVLLGLVGQNEQVRRVMIVQRLDSPSWYQVLWAMVPQTLIALGVALLLLAWAAVRRFGPLLPEPDMVRRSMLEHVEASSRWLWKSARGREILFDAARATTLKILLRRIPHLHAMQEDEKVALLAEQTGLLRSDIDSALHDNVATRPHDYTRQIQTLQRLRKHYER